MNLLSLVLKELRVVTLVVAAILTLLLVANSALALALGLSFGIIFGNPILGQTRRWTNFLLQLSIVGLGAGMNFLTVMKVGLSGFIYTAIGISLTLLLGAALARGVHVPWVMSFLLSTGTAICGGSAIAAVGPVIRAKDHEVSVSLGIVFFLNATALLVFPWVGHVMNLNEIQFGLWSALAIHDTSSVVGAAMSYGPASLEVATTVKLARALWIVPMVISTAYFCKKNRWMSFRPPWFIFGFIVLAAVTTWNPFFRPVASILFAISKKGMVLTLFLIGSGLNQGILREIGFRPLIYAIFLWLVVCLTNLYFITIGWIHF